MSKEGGMIRGEQMVVAVQGEGQMGFPSVGCALDTSKV